MTLNATIAELMLEKGRAQAQGALGGAAYGSALSNIGQNLGQAIQQATDPRTQVENRNLNDLKALDAAFNAPGGRDQILQRVPGHLRGQVQSSFDAADESAAKLQKAQLDADTANTDYVYTLASNVKAHDYTPTSLQLAISHAKDTFKNNPSLLSQLAPIEAQLQANPSSDAVKALIDPIIQTHNAQEKPIILPPTPAGGAPATAQIPGIGVVATGAPSQPKPKTEAELAVDAANPQSPTQKASADALALLKPKPPVTAEQDDARYRSIQAAVLSKQPVSPDDQAWASAYEKQKTLGPEASATAAANRQTATIAQQTAQQGRQQDFAEQQAGRAELTNKVEQPYLDAKEKASTLRSVIDAAKGGNMEAASVQSLLGTLGLVTMEGVKRINTTELNQVAGAGSLLEQIKAKASKLVAGQPLPTKLQDDLAQLSNMLEQSARKKYEEGFTQTTKRYKLKDEQMIADPSAAPAAQTGPKVGDVVNVGGKKVKITALHSDGTFDGDEQK